MKLYRLKRPVCMRLNTVCMRVRDLFIGTPAVTTILEGVFVTTDLFVRRVLFIGAPSVTTTFNST